MELEKLIVIILGVAGGALIVRGFDKWNVGKGQKKLELSSRDFDKIQANLEGQQQQEDKETKEKVDAITEEQNTKPTGSNLADWFNRRK